MAWKKGQNWRVVDSLNKLNDQIRRACPKALPPATSIYAWGSIADDEHNTSSDHYPHLYKALGNTAVVCARDFPHAPRFGLDAHRIADNLRRSRDNRIRYIISNGRITGPNYGWEWADYDGKDPHDEHIHVSSVHTSVADNTRDWSIGVGEWDVMASKEEIRKVVEEVVKEVLFTSKWKEYYDENKNENRDTRALPDMIFSTHRKVNELYDLIVAATTTEGK